MKQLLSTSFIFLLLTSLLSSCAAVEGIFKAGMSVGIFIVIAIVVIIIFIVARVGKK